MTKQETKHTPGPWQAYNRVGNRIFNQWRVYSDCLNQPCAICKMDESLTGDQEVANARLIAAAPDLLEACKAICEFWDEGKMYGNPAQLHADAFIGGHDAVEPITIHDVLRAAIAKAEGRNQ